MGDKHASKGAAIRKQGHVKQNDQIAKKADARKMGMETQALTPIGSEVAKKRPK